MMGGRGRRPPGLTPGFVTPNAARALRARRPSDAVSVGVAPLLVPPLIASSVQLTPYSSPYFSRRYFRYGSTVMACPVARSTSSAGLYSLPGA